MTSTALFQNAGRSVVMAASHCIILFGPAPFATFVIPYLAVKLPGLFLRSSLYGYPWTIR